MLCPRVNRTSILIRNFSTSIKANASRQVVEPRGKFTDTTTLLSSFGRSLQEKCKIEDWNQLFSSSSRDFERIGMLVSYSIQEDKPNTPVGHHKIGNTSSGAWKSSDRVNIQNLLHTSHRQRRNSEVGVQGFSMVSEFAVCSDQARSQLQRGNIYRKCMQFYYSEPSSLKSFGRSFFVLKSGSEL